ncbi:MAG: metal ABC transporter substrate-binding protein [Candidatus Methanofastidiosia archaeon]|jgi:ABC-type Zn uptake system ZnuABC Zn-binding protein ZnuA
MKKRLLVVILALVLVPAAQVECSPGQVTVVCTTTALQSVVQQVGGTHVDVITLVQPGICPSHFDVRPSHVADIQKAQLVLYHGMESWLQGLITASGNETITQVQVVGPWNTPELALEKIDTIKDALIAVDPENSQYYTENCNTARTELSDLATTILNKASAEHVKEISVICMEWQKFIVEWMGFSVADTYDPPETLSVKDVNSLIQTGHTYNAVLVIDSLQSGTNVGSQIAADIGAYHVVLTNFPYAVPETDTLAQMIEYNANQLLTAVQTYQEHKTIAELEHTLTKERQTTDIFQAVCVILLIVCIAEAVLLYTRQQ